MIENGEYSAEGTLSMEGIKVDSPDNSLILEENSETAARLLLDGGLTYAQRFIVNYPITDDVSVRGSFQMALPFNFMLDIKFSELKALDISIEPQFDLDLDIRGSLVNYKHEQSLATITLQPLIIGVVVITPVLELVLTTTVDGRLEIGVQAKAAFRAGVAYSGETGKWTPYSDKDIDVKFEQPSLVGSIEASMGIKKALKLYGVAGPYFTPEIYAGLKGEYDGNAVSFSAYQGLRARAGGEVTILNKKVVGIDFTLLDVRSDIELSNKTNLLPDADFSYSKNEISSGVYQVDFTDRSSDDDGSIVSREWDFDGDGAIDSTERNPSHTFRGVDLSTVTLTVQDNRLGENAESKTLIFNESTVTHTVSFNSNGGSSVSSQQVEEGSYASEPTAPTRSGYVFYGWYGNSSLTNAWAFGSDTVDSDIALYAKWEMSAVSGDYSIGDTGPAGGIIFYDKGSYSDGWRYLEAAPSDQGTVEWGGWGTTVGGTSTAIGSGKSNTEKIVNKLGSGSYAARLCYDLELGGYDDRFLPSKDELNELYQQKNAVGGFAPGNYWSSSENSSFNAWKQDFDDGLQFDCYK